MFGAIGAINLKSKNNQRMSSANIYYAIGLDQQAKKGDS
jgi:hypothetical protein